MQVFLHTFGCKVNQYESSWLMERFRERGYIQVNSAEVADVVLIHTCSVTSKSDAQCRQAIRKFARQNPKAHILITGCYARLRPEDLTALGGMVFTQNDFSDILNYLDSIQTETISSVPEKHSPLKPTVRSRAFVKIQDGCNSCCSYCIVPQARGKSRSRPSESIIEEIEEIDDIGYREVVLSGVHLGAYGEDLPEKTTPAKLVKRLLDTFPRLRFRLSSIEPGDVDEALLELFNSKRLCPHLHLPLQSASSRILKLMNRPYTPQEYKHLVKKILTTNPDIAIGTDIMVGFPSETTADFQLTESFVNSLPLAYLHVFVYSPRPHTPAAAFRGHLKPVVKKERGKIIRDISRRKRQNFIEKNLNSIRPTIVLSKATSDGIRHTGLTDNYIQVFFQTKENLAEFSGEVLSTRLTQLNEDSAGAWGTILW